MHGQSLQQLHLEKEWQRVCDLLKVTEEPKTHIDGFAENNHN